MTASYTPGSAVDVKAAFNNFPFQYGIVERTFSEYLSGALSRTLVSDYTALPADLRAGAIKAAFDSAKGDYSDGTPRYFSRQTCHVPATTGVGCNKTGVPTRTDLPLHDMTGGNYWMPDAIVYQNNNGTLRLGGGLTALQIDAINAGKSRATQQLWMAASLSVSGNTLKVTNLTGHKLISGYPEGRRMWLNIKWYNSADTLVREDGAYGNLSVTLNGADATVKTLLNLSDPNTRIYEAHYAMTREWANQLLSLGYPASMALSYDRVTGAVDYTLGQLAAQAPGTGHETFHFVLNNTVAKDNRIPPYGFSYNEARKRNALPVPATQYGSPSAGGTYNYWDEIALNPPVGASYAEIKLLYQPTSWEYVQFLYRANTGSNPFLAQEGVNLLNAWLNTGMAEPHVMTTATWETAAAPSAITMTPASAAFGKVALNFTSAPIMFTLKNNGASGLPLTIDSITLSGADAAMFNLNSGTCHGSLAVGQSCNFSVTFSPTTSSLKIASADVAVTGEPLAESPFQAPGLPHPARSGGPCPPCWLMQRWQTPLLQLPPTLRWRRGAQCFLQQPGSQSTAPASSISLGGTTPCSAAGPPA